MLHTEVSNSGVLITVLYGSMYLGSQLLLSAGFKSLGRYMTKGQLIMRYDADCRRWASN